MSTFIMSSLVSCNESPLLSNNSSYYSRVVLPSVRQGTLKPKTFLQPVSLTAYWIAFTGISTSLGTSLVTCKSTDHFRQQILWVALESIAVYSYLGGLANLENVHLQFLNIGECVRKEDALSLGALEGVPQCVVVGVVAYHVGERMSRV